jgi:hypothetical protein
MYVLFALLLQNADLVTIFENIRTRAKQAGMDANKDTLYNFFVQVGGPRWWQQSYILFVLPSAAADLSCCAPLMQQVSQECCGSGYFVTATFHGSHGIAQPTFAMQWNHGASWKPGG